jgi:hypothetical protein
LLVLVLAGAVGWWCVDQVRDRNEAAYGTRDIGILSEGGAGRAYVQWQRVDLGPVQKWVTVNTEQRRAVYRVSPAAAELEAHLEGFGTRWMGPDCSPPLPDDCEYPGGNFNWVLLEAAWTAGHLQSGAQADEFFNRMADEIEAACDDGRLPCVDPGPGMLPPLERLDTGRLWPALHIITTYMFSYDYGEPGPPRLSIGTAEQWDEMLYPLRGLDDTRSEYDARARAAADRQQAVAALADIYRWGARLGVVPALAGIVLAVVSADRRLYWRGAALGVVFLVAVVSRIVVLTIVEAYAFMARLGVYHLPASAFLIGFLLTGWWLLAEVIGDNLKRRRGIEADLQADRIASVDLSPIPASLTDRQAKAPTPVR